MSATEELQAAIEKLTKLRNDSTLAPWSVDEIPETGECRVIREFEFFGMQIEPVTSGGSQREDAALIVTLHRTIDAQLVILREGDFTGWDHLTDTERACQRAALVLARAINGTS